MPSALETLVKILKLEQTTGCEDKAVIGGLASFATEWGSNAHTQAKRPEHHLLVDELVGLLRDYPAIDNVAGRHELIKYMLGRITGRTPPPSELLTNLPPPHPPEPPRTEPPPRPVQAERPRREQPERARPPTLPSPPGPPSPPPHLLQVEGRKPIAEPVAETPERSEPIDPPSIDDLILEPIVKITPEPPRPRVRGSAPRRRPDNRTIDEKLGVLHAIRRPVSELHGIGGKIAEKLETVGINTIEDALNAFPRRFDDYTAMIPLNRLKPGEMVSAAGAVRSVAEIKGRRNIDVLNVVIEDGTGTLTASFFNQHYLRGKFSRGAQVVFSGKVGLFLGKLNLTNPHWEYIDQDALNTRTIVPVYPLTANLSAATMRKATDVALTTWGDQLPDPLPASVLDRTGLAEYAWAVRQLHRPESLDTLELARRRLVFDDLILLQLGVLRNRRLWQSAPADPLPIDAHWITEFEKALPYAPTNAQRRAIVAIRDDLARPVPMNRLLQGDVGSGKTLVATAALLMAVANGHQGALMAPTGILAEQHFRNLSRLIGSLPGGDRINIQLLTSATPAQERAEILWGLGEGGVQIIIGTHALIQEDVFFARLGVAVIDEQHRFGVEQRGRLRGKGVNPHVLIMTATPIPRTLALTMYADLDLTILDELPPGRTPIDTKVLFPNERERAFSFIRTQLDKGRQAFIVYPLVEASESEAMADVRSAVEEYERLSDGAFVGYRLGLLHGRMSPAEKDAVMAQFSAGLIQLLVSTSVVEVGIDVPNASVMLIEGANRFGLAQLHQFRGRVGRGEHPSFCLLIADSADEPDNPRLMAMQETADGFKLAEIDWELRGAGELLGTRQSGGAGRLAEYMSPQLVEMAQQEARALYEEDPTLDMPPHFLLRERLALIYGDEPSAEVS